MTKQTLNAAVAVDVARLNVVGASHRPCKEKESMQTNERHERAWSGGRGRYSIGAIVALACFLLIAAVRPASAQFNSGSSGIHGAFPPVPQAGNPLDAFYIVWNLKTGTVRYCSHYTVGTGLDTCNPGSTVDLLAQIPNIPQGGLVTGVYEFTEFVLPNKPGDGRRLIVVGYSPNTPLSILSQGDITFQSGAGTGNGIEFILRGWNGATITGAAVGFSAAGGKGGPGGFDGGASGNGSTTPSDGNAGFGPNGGASGLRNGASVQQTYGGHASLGALNPSLTPLSGGSGGGGAAGIAPGSFGCEVNVVGYGGGPGGGGGGGLLLAASGRVTLSAAVNIIASGGNGGFNNDTSCRLWGGAGAGGNVRIVAQEFTGSGTISIGGGFRGDGQQRAPGGFLRVEAATNTFTGNVDAASGGSFLSFPTAPIPATSPTLRITSVGGTSAPTSPEARLTSPDITFASPINSPVTVSVAASNVPVNTTVNIKVVPASGAPVTAVTSGLAGSTSSSTASTTVVLPPGAGVITATATFNVADLSASLFPTGAPLLDGQPPSRVEVMARADGTTATYLIASSGARFEWK